MAISESARRWITLLFALGTPFWYLASLGTYWFTAHVVVVCFALLATREALTRQRWFLVGLWLACAGFARPTALFLAPFLVSVWLYTARHSVLRFTYVLRSLLLFGLALAIGLGAHFAYNYARFKSFTDFGYAYVTGADNITRVYARYGGFNLRFVPCNLAVSLLSPPEVNGAVPSFITQACAYLLEGVNLADTSAPITPNPLGMSIFFVTPALLIVFLSLKPGKWRLAAHQRFALGMGNSRLVSQRLSVHPPSASPSLRDGQGVRGRGALEPVGAGRRSTEESPRRDFAKRPAAQRSGQSPGSLILAAWLGLLTTLLPLWLYHNTGSLQFGWRYLLDAAPMWIILLAAGMQKVTRLKRGLILVSIAINLWGLVWMFGKINGVPWRIF